MKMRLTVLTLAALLLMPAAASAQQLFAGGLGGITFGTETSSVFAGQVGGALTPQISLFVEFGRMQNVLPNDLQDQLDEFADLIADDVGDSVTLDARVPSLYGLGGIRWQGTNASVAPYVEAGGGFARLSLDLEATIGGIDFSDLIEEELENEDIEATEFLLMLGGGISWTLSDAARFDIGYRYNRIFTDDPAINASQIHAAIKFWF